MNGANGANGMNGSILASGRQQHVRLRELRERGYLSAREVDALVFHWQRTGDQEAMALVMASLEKSIQRLAARAHTRMSAREKAAFDVDDVVGHMSQMVMEAAKRFRVLHVKGRKDPVSFHTFAITSAKLKWIRIRETEADLIRIPHYLHEQRSKAHLQGVPDDEIVVTLTYNAADIAELCGTPCVAGAEPSPRTKGARKREARRTARQRVLHNGPRQIHFYELPRAMTGGGYGLLSAVRGGSAGDASNEVDVENTFSSPTDSRDPVCDLVARQMWMRTALSQLRRSLTAAELRMLDAYLRDGSGSPAAAARLVGCTAQNAGFMLEKIRRKARKLPCVADMEAMLS